MKKSLLNFICCPICKYGLYKKKHGVWCRHCHKKFEVKNGIPILVDFSNISKHLFNQIKYFEQEDTSRSMYVSEPWQLRYIMNFIHIGKPIHGIIVDNATGSGYVAIELARRGFTVIAIDLTIAELIKLQVNIKRLKLTRNIHLVCASSEELPIRSHIADGMVANAILEHLPREKIAIDEMGRVLKRNAPLMLAVPIKFKYVIPFLWPVNWWHDRMIGHLRRYDRENIIRKFKQFTEIVTYHTGHLPKVFCLAIYILTKDYRWSELGEKLDSQFEKWEYGASNVVSILKKK